LLELELDNSAILLRVDELIAAAQARAGTTIIVSNEVGMGLVSLSEIGRRFQDLTGWAHQRITAAADQVYVAILGMILRVRPSPVAVVELSRGRI
ncbi:MAG TPA: bifunctional adenosylcobinamide kinase/adenosylcobinamide-phosphate guanylyltransferase, partial [Polyangiaceae bacterium]|nr:bifunctional adenosylcobinamide kinase/adenosylcobinamide-phosphate guanylyltransferase [Polyangiaceae bacterium]